MNIMIVILICLIKCMESDYPEIAIKTALKYLIIALKEPIYTNSRFCGLLYGDNAVTKVYKNSSYACAGGT